MTRIKENLQSSGFWRALVVEFLGSVVLVLFGCGAWIQYQPSTLQPDPVRVALTFGFIYAALLYCFRCVSESNINTSVTFALLITRRCSFMRASLFIGSQLLGSVTGATMLYGVVGQQQRNATLHRIGCTLPQAAVSQSHAFAVEFVATFFFVFLFFTSSEMKEEDSMPEAVPSIVAGAAYMSSTLFALPYSGASLSSSRSFGPALLAGLWDSHLVYWFGPILGGLFGGAFHDLFFSRKASFQRIKLRFLVFNKRNPATFVVSPLNNEVPEDMAYSERKSLVHGVKSFDHVEESIYATPDVSRRLFEAFHPQLHGESLTQPLSLQPAPSHLSNSLPPDAASLLLESLPSISQYPTKKSFETFAHASPTESKMKAGKTQAIVENVNGAYIE